MKALVIALILTLSSTGVSSPSYWTEHRADHDKADKKYRGKRFPIHGPIRDMSATYNLYLEGGVGAVNGVVARLKDSEIQRAWNIQKGQVVYLNCEGAGTVFEEPLLLNCEIL